MFCRPSWTSVEDVARFTGERSRYPAATRVDRVIRRRGAVDRGGLRERVVATATDLELKIVFRKEADDLIALDGRTASQNPSALRDLIDREPDADSRAREAPRIGLRSLPEEGRRGHR